ncbi:MAG: Stp1/IreP family PP2C-type Ser/Thr phosphatase [Megasphaera sp.]|uniref:Stp1/IreP family PP2C-type Ser/Thr phosphatase n=1 Tax=Megasphaera sueciensis TaxID=349094 RepID=UPI003CFE556D|nr:Stp1/IreP family PP2C-type Ser/Thr phosphatase [Megasphaera sp.]MCI1823015.1 Stp1/IreP family PP2C-type Ser/Thr phosphatase [Megasphaera sp.]
MGIYGESKIGLVRKVNEDSFYISQEQDVFVVADGMGGYVGGEIASSTAVEAIAYYFQNYTHVSPVQLEKAVQYANSCILSKAMIEPSLKGMGTTVSLLTIADHKANWAHVGDSRIYVLRNNQLTQITVDHSIVEVLLDEGKITKEEAEHHPKKNILTRAVGVDRDLKVDTGSFDIFPGDRILLCTDGLNSFVNKDDLQKALQEYSRKERDIINDLFERVYVNGANDNVTAILVTI